VWETGEVLTEFWWGNLVESNHLEDLDTDGRIILKRILKIGMGGMEGIALPLNRDRWRALLNAVMNLWVP
jgi:hypothetical protein